MASPIPNSKRIARTKTTLPPCALRYHPIDPSLIFLGTYKLEEDGSRHGSIDIYKQDQDELILQSSTPTESAILDIKFSPFDESLLISAHSTGALRIWNYKSQSLTLIHHAQVFEKDVLITSIIFSQVHKDKILLTCTDGYAALVSLTQTGVSEPQYFGTQHDLECWTGAFGNMAELSNLVFTGGDDGSLIAHDTREPDSLAVFHARRIHEAGVVAIQTSTEGDPIRNGTGDWFSDKPYTLWTGSYDDNLRSLDLRVVPNVGIVSGIIPKVQEKVKLGGGVWRFAPSTIKNDNRLLTCCMYNGARIIGAKSDSEPIVERFFKQEHESMVYGCDWSPKGDQVATCSFYDCIVQVWSPDELE